MSKLEKLMLEKMRLDELLDKFILIHKNVDKKTAKEYYYTFFMIMLDEIFNTSKVIEIERLVVIDYKYKGKYQTKERKNSEGEIMFGGSKEKDEHIKANATLSSVVQKILKNRFTYEKASSTVESKGIVSTFYFNNNAHFVKTKQKTIFECVCEFMKECHYAPYKNFKITIEFDDDEIEGFLNEEQELLKDEENKLGKIYSQYKNVIKIGEKNKIGERERNKVKYNE